METDKKDKDIKDSRRKTVLLKAQKLASAVYLVTDFFDNQDPLKWRLRGEALTVATSLNLFNVENSLDLINRLVAYLDISLSASETPKMNLSILKEEYLKLGREILQNTETVESPAIELPVSKLEPIALKTPPKPQQVNTQQVNKGQETTPNPRREEILKFVRNHGESSIKDIARAVPNFSSKTVQRELAELVRSGTLKREGDRRWSRYRLNA